MLVHPAFIPDMEDAGDKGVSVRVRQCKWLTFAAELVVKRAAHWYEPGRGDPK
jgi:hypothetical protein